MKTRLACSFVFLPILLLPFAGCKSEPEQPPKPEMSIENLKVIHAVSFRRAEYYAAAGVLAEHERLGNLAALYRAIARSEQVHAAGHEALLKAKQESTDTTKSPRLP